jgi:hypothetical protein
MGLYIGWDFTAIGLSSAREEHGRYGILDCFDGLFVRVVGVMPV